MGGRGTPGEDRTWKVDQRSCQHDGRPEETITGEVPGEAKGDKHERVLGREDEEPKAGEDQIRGKGR